MIKRSETITHISCALLSFQGAVAGVHKGANNPHFKTKYANLETVIDTARPALQKFGIMFTQSAGVSDRLWEELLDEARAEAEDHDRMMRDPMTYHFGKGWHGVKTGGF